jgi:hypothetical protein
LRLRDGTFALTCRPLDLPGTDCGHTITNEVLEAGQLKGDNTTVWFIGDAQLLSELSGCELPTTEDDTDACFVVPPYSASWSQEGDQLVFTDSEVQHLTLATWLRVGE